MPIHIVFAVDAAYVPWVGVMLASVLRFDHGAPLHFHALSDAVDAASFGPIAAMAAAAGAQFSVHDVGEFCTSQADRLPPHSRVSRVTYARLCLGESLPADIGRAICLDVDLLCRASLQPLWALDLAGSVAAAARDFAGGEDAVGYLAGQANGLRRQYAQRIALPADGTYCNTGVMLVDLRRWREERIGDRALRWIAADPDRVEVADQDALNAVLHGRAACLDDRWNVLAMWTWREPENGTKIFHFAGADKPWHVEYAGYGAAEWRAVKAASPFRDTPLVARASQRGADANQRTLCVRGVPPGASGCEIAGHVGIGFPSSGQLALYLYQGEAALPAGVYAMELIMAAIDDDPAEPATAGGKRVRFEAGVGPIVLATVEFAVAPGMELQDMPVTIGFVLPGPVRILSCTLSAPAGVRVQPRLDITLTRLADAWRAAPDDGPAPCPSLLMAPAG